MNFGGAASAPRPRHQLAVMHPRAAQQWLEGRRIARNCAGDVVGLRRAGFTARQRAQIKQAFGTVYRSGLNVTQARERLLAETDNPFAAEFAEFLSRAKRGICRPSFDFSEEAESDA